MGPREGTCLWWFPVGSPTYPRPPVPRFPTRHRFVGFDFPGVPLGAGGITDQDKYGDGVLTSGSLCGVPRVWGPSPAESLSDGSWRRGPVHVSVPESPVGFSIEPFGSVSGNKTNFYDI